MIGNNLLKVFYVHLKITALEFINFNSALNKFIKFINIRISFRDLPKPPVGMGSADS